MEDVVKSILEKTNHIELLTKKVHCDAGKNQNACGRTLLGLSGGADSVYLFRCLLEARNQGGPDFTAVHINHMLRGEAADADEEFVRKLCESCGVKLHAVRIDVSEKAEREHKTLEQAGRMARYDEFFNCIEGEGVLFLAHHGCDQEETVLMNFLRGSGPRGLAGIRETSVITQGEKSIRVERPLLHMTHEDIKRKLVEMGQDWREDATNAETDCTRNKLRLKIIPELTEIYPGLFETLGREAELFGDIDDYLKTQADEFLGKKAEIEIGKASVLAEELKILHPALQKYVIRGMVRSVEELTDVGAGHVDAIIALTKAQSGKTVDLPRNLRAIRDFDKIVIRDMSISQNQEETEVKITFMDRSVTLTDFTGDKFTKWFDADAVRQRSGAEPVIRNPKPDDYLIINAQGNTKNINTYLKQEKISADRRAATTVVAAGHIVLWVPGHRNSEGFRVTGKTTHLLKLSIGGQKS